MHLDLHLHTTCSDGAHAPEEVAAMAHRAGLSAIAVTDHDTTKGCARAQHAGRALGLVVVPGIEISCLRGAASVHLLGYGIDPEHRALLELTAALASLRRGRLVEIVDRLRALGVAIGPDDVRPGSDNEAVGRPHVADALVRLGVVRHAQEAFHRFLRAGGPAHVPSRGPEVAEAVAAVHAAGGCAVWAHPSLEDARAFAVVARDGLDGAETMRPNLTGATSSALERAARGAGLFVTGGSDWHGGNPPLGRWYVTDAHVGALLARLGISRDSRRSLV